MIKLYIMKAMFFHCQEPEFEEVKRIRNAVFTQEQGIPVFEDLDSYDRKPSTVYCLVRANERYIAVGRLTETDGVYKIGRVAVLKEYRNRHAGALLVRALCDRERALGARYVVLESQLHAVGFYERLGFEVVSEEAVFDRGIEHRKMRFSYGEKE